MDGWRDECLQNTWTLLFMLQYIFLCSNIMGEGARDAGQDPQNGVSSSLSTRHKIEDVSCIKLKKFEDHMLVIFVSLKRV